MLLAANERGLAQETQMMANRRLAQVEVRRHLADTERRAMLDEQGEHPQPRLIR